jgi:hypothetical protein
MASRRAGFGLFQCRRQSELQRDERYVRHDEGDRPVFVIVRLEITGVEPLDIGDAVVIEKTLVHLPVADIDRGHVLGAAFDEHFGKAAGGGADIEAVMAGGIELEMVEPRHKLQRRAGYIILRGVVDGDGHVGLEGQTRLGDDTAVDGDGATADRIARTRAAGHEVERDQKLVETLRFGDLGHGLSMTGVAHLRKSYICTGHIRQHVHDKCLGATIRQCETLS